MAEKITLTIGEAFDLAYEVNFLVFNEFFELYFLALLSQKRKRFGKSKTNDFT